MTSDNEVLYAVPYYEEYRNLFDSSFSLFTRVIIAFNRFCVLDWDSTFYATVHSVQPLSITQYIIQFFINWFQIGVVHHKNEECSDENRMCHYLRRVLEIVDLIVLSAQIDHMLPVVNSHCVAKTTTPYINYIAGKTSFLLLHRYRNNNSNLLIVYEAHCTCERTSQWQITHCKQWKHNRTRKCQTTETPTSHVQQTQTP